jgi:hypothetical protein
LQFLYSVLSHLQFLYSVLSQLQFLFRSFTLAIPLFRSFTLVIFISFILYTTTSSSYSHICYELLYIDFFLYILHYLNRVGLFISIFLIVMIFISHTTNVIMSCRLHQHKIQCIRFSQSHICTHYSHCSLLNMYTVLSMQTLFILA